MSEYRVTGVDWQSLVGRLVTDDPLTWSTEGLDDGCFFCDAMPRYEPPDYKRFAIHHAGCVWVEAMRALDRDLGLHQAAEV